MTKRQCGFMYTNAKDTEIDYNTITKGNHKRANRFSREFNELYDLFDNGNDRFMKAVYDHMTAC